LRIITRMHKWRALIALALVIFCTASSGIRYGETSAELRREARAGMQGSPRSASGHASYDNSLVITPLYVDYVKKTADQFSADAAELKRRLGSAPYVLLGFAGYIDAKYPDLPLSQSPTEADLKATLDDADVIVQRARDNGLVTHISIISGFFHNRNDLRVRAIRDDVRNAQWFADGWIAPPADLTDPEKVPDTAWTTPSRYAQPLHARIEEGTRILGRHLAALMARYPDVFLSVSADAETEFTFLRNFDGNGSPIGDQQKLIYADYSPFMVAEFRDWLVRRRYAGDLSPASDDNGDGRTFNQDFKQSFKTWRLRYYDNSGPISYQQYLRLPEKLPESGPYAVVDGFDAPRTEAPQDPFWQEWNEFRKQVITNWQRDYAGWIRRPDPAAGFQIPAARYYTHQIPADLIFGRSDTTRLKTSASYIATAILDPIASTGVTAFNGFNGRTHSKTATPELYARLYRTSDNWGIMEYNPSIPYAKHVPPANDIRYYNGELRMLYNFRPHVLVPFAWTDYEDHRTFSIKGSVFERALRQFVQEVGGMPWNSARPPRS
jgi:hypothetical protein